MTIDAGSSMHRLLCAGIDYSTYYGTYARSHIKRASVLVRHIALASLQSVFRRLVFRSKAHKTFAKHPEQHEQHLRSRQHYRKRRIVQTCQTLQNDFQETQRAIEVESKNKKS